MPFGRARAVGCWVPGRRCAGPKRQCVASPQCHPGRRPGIQGAVGRFEKRASDEPRRLDAGSRVGAALARDDSPSCLSTVSSRAKTRDPGRRRRVVRSGFRMGPGGGMLGPGSSLCLPGTTVCCVFTVSSRAKTRDPWRSRWAACVATDGSIRLPGTTAFTPGLVQASGRSRPRRPARRCSWPCRRRSSWS